MDQIARYVLGVAVCGTMIVTFYRTALYGRVSFRVARIFLVGSIALAAAIPALEMPVWRSEPIEPIEPIEIPYNIEVAKAVPEIGPPQMVEPTTDWLAIGLWALYGAGVAAVLGMMGWQMATIRRLRRTSRIERIGNTQVAVNQVVGAPFSFLGTIFVPPLDTEAGDIQDARQEQSVWKTPTAISAGELRRIVTHEQSHIRHRHSAERLVAQALTAIVWWNPAAWWALKLLAEVHEFEADSDVLKDGCTVDEYLPLIFRQAFGVIPEISVGMAHSLTKKRFEMMLKNLRHNKLSALRVAGVLPIIGAGLMLFSFTAKSPEIVYTNGETAVGTTLETPQTPQTPQAPEAPDKPTHHAEVMPKFNDGGIVEFRSWVQSQIVYPKEAMEQGVSGKVTVRFVVEKDGSVTGVEGLSSPDESLTAEVVRVVKTSPKWTPGTQDGKPANVFYVLPIDFILQQDVPKVLVDGKEVENIDDIDPEKIEKIDVAKDGTISVTTKKEMVDLGYGEIDRRRNTSAVSTVDMRGVPSYNNLRDYIRGRVSGVQFLGDVLVVRGINSINSGIEALVVVDGVPMSSFADANAAINPADVASITVLKDAGSTAIYGVRGSNGVVLIRTKSGR